MTNVKISNATKNQSRSLTSEREERKQDIGEVANQSSISTSNNKKMRSPYIRDNGSARTCWTLIMWIPKRCRWDPDDPPKFTMTLNLVFAFVSALLLGSAAAI